MQGWKYVGRHHEDVQRSATIALKDTAPEALRSLAVRIGVISPKKVLLWIYLKFIGDDGKLQAVNPAAMD